MSNREKLAEISEEAIVFENPDYDRAIIGADTEGRAVYDYDEMVRCLMEDDGMTEEEAADFIDYNTIRSLPYAGEMAPVIIYKLPEG